MRIVPLAEVQDGRVEQLLDHAFGPDRHLRTAYRLRQGVSPVADLSLAAVTPDGELLGSIQCWPVQLTSDTGDTYPIVMVGPVAVEPSLQRGGIGRRLMTEMLARFERLRTQPQGQPDALMLIGDPEYYGRFFGFDASRTGQWRLPGPFERHRLLARGSGVPDVAGHLGPRLPAPV